VAVWPLPDRDNRVVLRRYTHGGALGRLFGYRFWGASRPIQELVAAEHARSNEVAVPLVLGVVVERLMWPTCRAVLITAEVPDSEDMVHFLRRIAHETSDAAWREKGEVIGDAAHQIRAMHLAGIDHADLHLKNLLVHHEEDGRNRVVLVDLDRARVHASRRDDVCMRNLMRLARSVRKLRVSLRALTRWDRLRISHEIWWWLTRPERDLRGDRLPSPHATANQGGKP
jgi:tRNA A-37 threonylcarbamoyl transferase component Bud32